MLDLELILFFWDAYKVAPNQHNRRIDYLCERFGMRKECIHDVLLKDCFILSSILSTSSNFKAIVDYEEDELDPTKITPSTNEVPT
jgi:hypothetical protein